jgi:Flp pilus assembly secretin CpaC
MTEGTCPLSETVEVVMNRVGNVMRLDTPFRNVHIEAPTVVDVEVLTDQRFLLHGGVAGRTNIVFYDKDNNPIKNLDVLVRADPSRVRVFNRPMFGTTVYECTPVGCEFVSATHYDGPSKNENIHVINETGSSTK